MKLMLESTERGDITRENEAFDRKIKEVVADILKRYISEPLF